MAPRPITSVNASINVDPDGAADIRCEHGLWCIHIGCLWDRDRDRDQDWYYAETFHTGGIWGQDWIPESLQYH